MRENQCVANDVMNVITLQSYHGGVHEGEKLLTMLLQPWGRWNRRKSEERTSKLLSKGKMFLYCVSNGLRKVLLLPSATAGVNRPPEVEARKFDRRHNTLGLHSGNRGLQRDAQVIDNRAEPMLRSTATCNKVVQ